MHQNAFGPDGGAYSVSRDPLAELKWERKERGERSGKERGGKQRGQREVGEGWRRKGEGPQCMKSVDAYGYIYVPVIGASRKPADRTTSINGFTLCSGHGRIHRVGFRHKTNITTTIKLVTSCKLTYNVCNVQLPRDPITTAMKRTRCKEMGGATSNACQSGARSVSKRLISSIGR